ncbi:hypothetical protein L798_14493 [Zootermopsis nevadensis]|uniref:Uncharacterized protein n=1 Tax=Zootermopsis nevadensis TaxID=136037 RepID=A0A067RS33_ZOONE|nr:hypothetical protein L798_14493 [Zootermopsis nevadensis]
MARSRKEAALTTSLEEVGPITEELLPQQDETRSNLIPRRESLAELHELSKHADLPTGTGNNELRFTRPGLDNFQRPEMNSDPLRKLWKLTVQGRLLAEFINWLQSLACQ